MSRLLWKRLWQQLLPNCCQLCGGDNTDLVCQSCAALWGCRDEIRCLRCARRLNAAVTQAPICGKCLSSPPAFRATIVLGDYAVPQDRLIWAFKFGSRLALAHFFAEQLAGALQRPLTVTIADYYAAAAIPAVPDLLVPIPLSPKRLRQRGYNQAWEIARRLGRLKAVPARADVLVKVRDTLPQMELPLKERHKNLRGAFTVNRDIAGLHIAVVDDVMTSGATLHLAARVLLQAGALSVQNYVVLRTPAE